MKLFYAASILTFLVDYATGHGYLTSPRSRNYDASINGAQSSEAGVPPLDYCAFCLNTNEYTDGICGKNSYNDYDNFKDSLDQPMPWVSLAEYSAGETIDIDSYLDSHHNGHMEIRACPNGDASTLDCLNGGGNELIFVEDLLYGMPADPDYPERGYYWGGETHSQTYFHMRFKLPDHIIGVKVLLQWKYITANKCSPSGYAKYFTDFNLPDSYWKPSVTTCESPYPADGSLSAVWPEQFFNCASVTIIDPVPTTPPAPTRVPTTDTPASSQQPTPKPVDVPTWEYPVASLPTGDSNGIPFPCCGWHSGGCEQPGNAWCHDMEGQCTGACVGQWYTGSTGPTPTYASPPTNAPLPTNAPVPTTPITRPPIVPGVLFSTGSTLSSSQVLQELSSLKWVVSSNPPEYALLASGGAAGSGDSVVTESQAYSLLISAVVLASWDTHSDGGNWGDAVQEFEGYYNGWKKMCLSSSAPCQSDKFCGDDLTSGVACLPGWRHSSSLQEEDTGAAVDGDEDAIVGMILALKAFDKRGKPSFYDDLRRWADASSTSFLYYNSQVHPSSSSHRLLKLGSCWGGWGDEGTNPSYHSPGSFKVMRDFNIAFPSSDRLYSMPNFGSGSLEGHWNNLIDTSYEVLHAVQCPDQGMVPNWATVDLVNGQIQQTSGSFSGSGTPQWEYGSEAARTTWRVALDAALYPDDMYRNAEPYLSPVLSTLTAGSCVGDIVCEKAFDETAFTTCQHDAGLGTVYMFGSWIWNAFIFAPTISALVVPIKGVSASDQQALIDYTGSKLTSGQIPQSYYPRCWTLIGSLTLSGAVESAGRLLASNLVPVALPTNVPVAPVAPAPVPVPPVFPPMESPFALPTNPPVGAPTDQPVPPLLTSAPTSAPVTPPNPTSVVPLTPTPIAPPTSTPAAPIGGGNTSNGIQMPCCGWNDNGCEQPDNAWCHALQGKCTGACSGHWYEGGTPSSPTPAPVNNTADAGCCTWGGWSTCPAWTQGSSDACQMTQAGCQNCSGSWIGN